MRGRRPAHLPLAKEMPGSRRWRGGPGMTLWGVPRVVDRQPSRVLAISLSLNFWILPVEVLGMSVNTTWRGTL
jgi:hypothetical protein